MAEQVLKAQVTTQLERILADTLFRNAPRLSRFLRFGVETVLADASADLKEYTVGVEVFERSANYNPSVDPIVRIMAGRLRAKLAEYYVGAGAGDPVLIDVPRGGYVPKFTSRSIAPPPPPAGVRRESVGRHDELAQLRGRWHELPDTGGCMVTVSGDAGTGKTTFVEDFLAEVHTSAVVARGRCSERLAETDAFAPLLDALDGIVRAGGSGADLLQSAAPSWYAQVTTAQSRPGSHERMRRELAAFFEALARLHPVIIFLDDLHWADTSTCEMLAYLGQRLRSAPVLVIGSYRPGALLADGHPFLPVKLRLQTWGICHDVPLSHLTRDDVTHYLKNTFAHHQFPKELATILHDRTEGHPLFLNDLVRYLVAAKMLAQVDGVWRLVRSAEDVRRVLPVGTLAMIAVKLSELDETDRDILRCGAVQGVQFDSAVVSTVLSIDPVIVEDRLRALDSVHTLVHLVEEQDRPGQPSSLRYRFVHVFYQNALYASLSPSRRVAHSVAVADTLCARASDAERLEFAEIAVLYELGRDHARAAQYFLRAARHAVGVFAHPEAILLCERGLHALATLPASRDRDHQELILTLTLGMALMSTRGYAAPDVERTYRRARELCLQLNDGRRLVPVLWAIHTCVTNAGKLPESLAVALEMRGAADALGDAESIVESLHAHGTTLAFMGRLEEARQVLERIFAIAPIAQHEFRGSLYVIDPLVTSLSMLARVVTLLGDFDTGRVMASESLDLAHRVAHPHSLAYARFWIGWVLQTGGDHAGALPHLDAAMDLGRTHDLPLIVEWGRVVHGAALGQLGRRDEGILEMKQSLMRQEAMGSGLARPYCLTLLAEALLAHGDATEALSLCDSAIALANTTQSLDFQPETHRLRAKALGALGHPDSSVRAELTTGLRLAREHGCLLLERRIQGALSPRPGGV